MGWLDGASETTLPLIEEEAFSLLTSSFRPINMQPDMVKTTKATSAEIFATTIPIFEKVQTNKLDGACDTGLVPSMLLRVFNK